MLVEENLNRVLLARFLRPDMPLILAFHSVQEENPREFIGYWDGISMKSIPWSCIRIRARSGMHELGQDRKA